MKLSWVSFSFSLFVPIDCHTYMENVYKIRFVMSKYWQKNCNKIDFQIFVIAEKIVFCIFLYFSRKKKKCAKLIWKKFHRNNFLFVLEFYICTIGKTFRHILIESDSINIERTHSQRHATIVFGYELSNESFYHSLRSHIPITMVRIILTTKF